MQKDNTHRKILKQQYQTLIVLGIPTAIIDDYKKWLFFLQEGWDVEMSWHYAKKMTEIQQIQFYRFAQAHHLESSLANEIELKYNLKDKQRFEIRMVKSNNQQTAFDFFINGEQLSKKLGVNRFDMMYCDVDLDVFSTDKTKFPNYNRQQINTNAVSQFLGNSKPKNQFGTNRIILYRDHSGSDYCGVISFCLEQEDDVVIWKNITYEDDDFETGKAIENKVIKPIKELKFNAKEYHLEFENYLQRIKDISIKLNKNG